jgi:MmeI, target recognition domain/MmeI, DNA-methyltransferase domain/MmeI, C-terminal domain
MDESVNFGNVDYIGCWFIIAARNLANYSSGAFAFVSTSSLFQGEQVEIILYVIKKYGLTISWAHTSFVWSNNAANNAGVICCIVGCAKTDESREKYIYEKGSRRQVNNIGPYLVPMSDVVVVKRQKPLSDLTPMSYGSMANDDGLFTISETAYRKYIKNDKANESLIKLTIGGAEFIRGIIRRSLYVDDKSEISNEQAREFSEIFDGVRAYREVSNRAATRKLSNTPMFFAERRHIEKSKIFVPQVLSERREYITAGLLSRSVLVIAPHMQVIDGNLFEFSILSSKMHHVWAATVCGRLKSDIRYSNLLAWNTFPVPALTNKNKEDLSRCAADVLVAREAHFPATIADLYDPEEMPEDLRRAHDRNDEALERIYIGRQFRNNTERLEKLFDLYAKFTFKESGVAA